MNNTKTPISSSVGVLSGKEEDFQTLQRSYRFIIENAHEGIWMVDKDGVTTYVNERVAEMLGTRKEEMKHRSTFDFFFPEDFEKASEVSARFATNTLQELEFRLKKTDGSELWTHVTIAPIRDSKGNAWGSIGLLTDITERKKIERALKESEEQYRIFFNQELVGALEVEIFTGRILAANRKACEILGYAEDELKNTTALALTYIEDKNKYLENFSLLSSGEIPFYTTEKRYVRKDQSVVWTNVTVGMVKDSKGLPLHSAAIIVDITEQKMLQRKVLRKSELRQKSLTKAILKGQEKERQMIGRELHDNVNQVLAVIKLYNEASLTSDEAGRERFIQKSIKFLNDCMKEIRKISKALVIPNFDSLSLVDSVRELINSINSTNKLNISLSNRVNECGLSDDIRVAAYRIIQEHLSNVLKHSEATELKIEISVANGMLTIDIVDNGKGFNFKLKRKGIGISNMISRAAAANGHIVFNTSKGMGCAVSVSFPVIPYEPVADNH